MCSNSQLREAETDRAQLYSQHYLDSGSAVYQTGAGKNIGQWQNWRLNYFRDNLYDFLWERSRKSWAVKATLQPWLGHADIDLTVKTGAGELWCHDSVLSLLLSVKEDGEQEEEEEGSGTGCFEEREKWRLVKETLQKTGWDKADELEVYLNCS